MVYVDDMYTIPMGRFGRMKMSHMASDTPSELLEMCYKIGMNTKWIQKQGKGCEHFDVSISMRKKAIDNGAIPVPMRTLCVALNRRKTNNETLLITPASSGAKR